MVNITKSPIYMKDIRIKSILVDFALSLISDFWKFSILHRTMQTSTVSTDNLLVWSEQFNLFNLITLWTVDDNAVEKYDNWCNTVEFHCVQFLNVYVYIFLYVPGIYLVLCYRYMTCACIYMPDFQKCTSTWFSGSCSL